MIRTVQTEIITETIKKMCIEANYSLSSDMVKAMRKAEEKEESVLGKQILAQLQDNLDPSKWSSPKENSILLR